MMYDRRVTAEIYFLVAWRLEVEDRCVSRVDFL